MNKPIYNPITATKQDVSTISAAMLHGLLLQAAAIIAENNAAPDAAPDVVSNLRITAASVYAAIEREADIVFPFDAE